MVAVPKKTEDVGSPAEVLRVARFRISRPKEKQRLMDVVYRTKHLENILLLLRLDLLEQGHADVAKSLLKPAVVRSLVAKTPGGSLAAELTRAREVLASRQLFKDFLAVSSELKEKNIHALTKKIRAAFASYYTKRAQGDQKAQPPKTKKLAKVCRFAVAIDQCAFSLKRKNCLRLNLGKKMESFHLSHEQIIAACGSLAAVQAVEIAMAHGEIYLHLSYRKRASRMQTPEASKPAGIDLGLKNIASLFIADTQTPSFIVEGSALKQYNAKFNRKVSELRSQRDRTSSALAKMDAGPRRDLLASKLQEISKSISRKYRERSAYFGDCFHKCAHRLLEYCQHAKVTDLYLSRNLGFLKQQPGLQRVHNQKFCEIPMVKLIDHLKDKAGEYGIRVCDGVDEAYSSKVSCISGDVIAVQQEGESIREIADEQVRKQQRARLSNAFGGRRDRRDRYVDFRTGKKFLADLNGAANHIKLAVNRDFSWLSGHIWKLANPIVIKCDSMFLDLRFAKFCNKEERPESRRKSWLYATWSPVKAPCEV